LTDDQTNIVPLSRPKTDAEKAADYRERVGDLIGQLLTIMREAEHEDFRIEFSVGRDPIGMPYCMGPFLTKRF
jgi:hypothetical protein